MDKEHSRDTKKISEKKKQKIVKESIAELYSDIFKLGGPDIASDFVRSLNKIKK